MKMKFITNGESQLNGAIVNGSHTPVVDELMHCAGQWLKVKGVATNITVSDPYELNSYPDYQFIVMADVLQGKPLIMQTEEEIKYRALKRKNRI